VQKDLCSLHISYPALSDFVTSTSDYLVPCLECNRLAIFDIVVISTIPCTKEGVVAGAISPGVIKVVVGVVDLVIGHMSKGRCAVDDPGGNTVVGIGIRKGFDTFKALFRDVFKVHS
jgi:hypothetical protein